MKLHHRPREIMTRTWTGVALAAALALTLAGCAESEDSTVAAPSASAPAATATTATQSATTTPSPSATPSEDGTVIEIGYAGGKVTRSDDTAKVDVGSKVTIRVTADVEDEVHVHG